MGVLIQLLKLGSGLVAAAMLLERLPNPDVPIPPKYEYWVRILATLCASPAWAIIFQARPMDIPIMTATALFGNLCVFAVSKFTEPTQEVQTVLAAFGIGLISNIWSRFFDVPAAVPTVVGILTLVPGSIGLSAIKEILDHDTTEGMQILLQMILTGFALVLGLLLSAQIIPQYEEVNFGR